MRKGAIYFLLSIITLLAFTLRFYKLGSYPSFNADEAAIGYNAYSLLETGKDEHGNPWPIHFQSFNDYKPGFYFYLALPFVAFFGLSEIAVRAPGAFLGVLTVVLIYFLVKELSKKIQNVENGTSFALLAAALLAINPWHIHFSRGAWEVNVATFFIVIGVWLFLKALNDSRVFFLSFGSFVLSLYSYHSARVVVPLMGLGLIYFYRDEVKLKIKPVLIAGFISLILLLPLARELVGGSSILARAGGVGLFADQGPLNRINEQRGEHAEVTSLTGKVLHNKLVNYGLAFLENWGEHYHGLFLFLSGDEIQRNKVPETGQLYMFDIVLVIFGLYMASKDPKHWAFIIFWLLIAPVASALTFQSPHALRSHNMVIPLVVVAAHGLTRLIAWVKTTLNNRIVLNIAYFLLIGVLTWQFARYSHMYWIHMSKEYPYSSQYGVKELVQYVEEEGKNWNRIVITDRYDQPYILFLFYLKYPPQDFQNNHSLTDRDIFGFSTVSRFDKYEFRSIDLNKETKENPRALIIGTDEEIPVNSNVAKKIYGSNGFKYFEVVEN